MPWKQHASGWCSGGIRISDPDTGAVPFFDGTEWTGKSLPEIIDETARPLKADRLHGDPGCGLIKWDDVAEEFTNVEILAQKGIRVDNEDGCEEGPIVLELDVGEGCGLLVRLDDGDLALRELVEGNGIAITNEDGCSGNPTISRSSAAGAWRVVLNSDPFPTMYSSLNPTTLHDPLPFRSLLKRSEYVNSEENSPFVAVAGPEGVALDETNGALTVEQSGFYQFTFSLIVYAPAGGTRSSGVYVVVNGDISPPNFSKVFVHTAAGMAYHEVATVVYVTPEDEIRVMAHDITFNNTEVAYLFAHEAGPEFPINITPTLSLFRVG